MSKFNEPSGKESMMRRLTWLIVIAGLSWGTAEVIWTMIMSKYGVEFDIHETLIITVISVGVAGKGVQKAIEVVNRYKS